MDRDSTLPEPRTPSEGGGGAPGPRGDQDHPGRIPLSVSVIIPTYNRRKWLGEILASIALQTLPFNQFEVIVVDDGSSDTTSDIVQQVYPFRLRYFYQSNQGDAAARNLGAKQSQADILVFLDDDMILEKDFLANMVADPDVFANRLIVGADILWLAETNPLDVFAPVPTLLPDQTNLTPIPFVDVCSNNLAMRREAYFAVGMMEWLNFPGSSIWCDVDFAYRAFQKGFECVQNSRAFCWHRDHVAKNLQNHKKRLREAAYRAVVLFQKYPELVHYLPMFSDKTPVDWKQDSLNVIVRKLIRHLTSSWPVLWVLEKVVEVVRDRPNLETLDRALGRWVMGGYIFRGYREGLKKFGPIQATAKPVLLGSVRKPF